MNKKRFAAIAALCLIGALYMATLIFALMDSPFARSCLMASLFCTIVVPVIVYGYMIFLRTRHSNEESNETDESNS